MLRFTAAPWRLTRLVAVALAHTGHIHKSPALKVSAFDQVADIQLGGIFQVGTPAGAFFGETPALFRWPISGLVSLRSGISS